MTSAPPRLSDADARVLDALMEVGFDPTQLESLSPEDRARAEAIMHLLGRLEALPAPAPSEHLVSSVMSHIDAAEAATRDRMKIRAPMRIARRLRIPDLVTIAAVLLLAVGVGWPIMRTMRSASLREACERNLGTLSAGLDRYASDNGGRLPLTAGFASFLQPGADRASPSAPGAPSKSPTTAAPKSERLDWRTYRHGESLELLRARDYVGSRCLTCPGCAKDRGALAFRVPASGQRFTRSDVAGMLVADANPALELLRGGDAWQPGASVSSLNHSSQGQNVLFDDGSVRWLLSPLLLNGDSIWIPGDLGHRSEGGGLDRGGLPSDPKDHFLAQ